MGMYEEQNSTENIEELLFLKRWFLEHIQAFDKKCAQYKMQSY
jgi:hemerythrin